MDGQKYKLAIINKLRAWRIYTYSRTRASYIDYALNRNSCTNIIRNSKLSYESKVALESKTNNKSFWKYVNSKLKTRTGVGNLLKSDGTLTNTDEEKVNPLNDYFTSVFTHTDDLNEDPDVKEMDTFLDNIDVTVDEVLKKLSCLKTDKSAGPDSLHQKVLFDKLPVICII